MSEGAEQNGRPDVPLGGRLLEGGARGARRLAGVAGIDRTLEVAVEEAIVQAIESAAVERALARIVEDGRLQAAIEQAIDGAQIEDAVRRAIESEVADRIWEDILASDKAQMLVERIAEAPEVRAAIAQQGFGLITDIGRQVSRITEAVDDVAERVAHALLRRRGHESETDQVGLLTRLTAFAIDGGLLAGFLSITSGLLASIIPAAFGDGAGGLSTVALIALIGAGLTFAGSVFVTFWTLIGQTPGMRFLGIRLRVLPAAARRGGPVDRMFPPPQVEEPADLEASYEIGFRRSLTRLLAIPFAVLPLGLGILAILISPRRRGLHDYLAGTEVIYDEASAPWSLAPRDWVHHHGTPEQGRHRSASGSRAATPPAAR